MKKDDETLQKIATSLAETYLFNHSPDGCHEITLEAGLFSDPYRALLKGKEVVVEIRFKTCEKQSQGLRRRVVDGVRVLEF